ncbi:right-handed parallel beta-helix repeat-containing protein [candidate division CSSED10-310 bacterium]|uniref:Right-handed parallel beta-helix repeat-containing protein n=1 Tax=candidate division CSSED10-310 bacterium TaxID=2855610 RepID=A0ABV6Z4H8_UNCC1
MLTKRVVFVCCTILVFGFTATGFAQSVTDILQPEKGKVWYVSINKGKGFEGTKEQPMKNIAKAVDKASPGDVIAVTGGTYSGVRGCGYVIFEKSVKLYGSFSDDWTSRDLFKNPSVFQPLNQKSQRKAFFKFNNRIKDEEDIVIDGFLFDMGERNSYHDTEGKPEGCETGMLLLPPQKNTVKNDKATVTEQCIHIESMSKGRNITIKNCVFVNGAKFAIQAGHKKGTFKIFNNVFVSNRMAAIEIFGIGGKKGPRGPTAKDGHVEVAYNTILFSWSRIKDFQDMGYGCRVMTKLSYDIHHNLIGGNIMAGVDHSRFNKDEWLKLDHNVFFVNKGGDLEYSPDSNTKELIKADEFEDLEFASVEGNKNEIPKTLPIDKAYLEGFLSARYSEKADFDRNSPSNQWRQALGMNMQGKLTTKVTMFGNKYPWKNTLELFGAVKNAGAQKEMK